MSLNSEIEALIETIEFLKFRRLRVLDEYSEVYEADGDHEDLRDMLELEIEELNEAIDSYEDELYTLRPEEYGY